MRFFNLDIEHHGCYPWQFTEGRKCTLRLRCNERARQVEVVFGDPFWFIDGDKLRPNLHKSAMELTHELLDDKFYTITIGMETHKLRYHFIITLEDGSRVFLTESGITEPVSEEFIRPFQVPYVFEDEHYCAPCWAEDTVWYQIFPERFSRDGAYAPDFVPTRENRWGGTLKGIEKHVPYLARLGVQGVYLNPVFKSPSNHRYDTTDYSLIDPMLGTEEDFSSLVKTLHENGLRIMLDGVFNHCSWEHPFWQDVIKNGKSSPYYSWFYIDDVEYLAGTELKELTSDRIRERRPFECFAFAANMPKWNTENDAVIHYLVSQAVRWTEKYEIDAWRLDVPDEVSMRFLQAFRRRIREAGDGTYIIGEIWQEPTRWIERAAFDGTMDYPLYFAVRDFAMLGEDDLGAFAARIKKRYLSMPESVHHFEMSFCSNHDIPRALTLCGGDRTRARTALFFSMLLGGAVSIYYGDETGMTGGEDPLNRGAMNWYAQDGELFRFYSDMIRLKREHLRGLSLQSMELSGDVLKLTFSGEKPFVAFITAPGGKSAADVPEGKKLLYGTAETADGVTYICSFALFG